MVFLKISGYIGSTASEAWKTVGNAVESAYGSMEKTVSDHLSSIGDVLFSSQKPEESASSSSVIEKAATEIVPVIWMVGKVQSGKTSIVSALTGASDAEIGRGFKACTKQSRIFNFPEEAPVVRFLDTRGFGEEGYDPNEDIHFCEGKAHLVLAVMRSCDPGQASVIETLQHIRSRHPDWPIVIAQTCLHEGYRVGEDHTDPYPYDADPATWLQNTSLPTDLVRSLGYQRGILGTLPGNGPIFWVPVDLTKPDEGYTPHDYGLTALRMAIEKAAPLALKVVVEAMIGDHFDGLAAQAMPQIWRHALVAAGTDAVPAIGLIGVPAIQAKMLHNLATVYGVRWDSQMWRDFVGALGAGFMLRYTSGFLLREAVKFIPGYGQVVGAVGAALFSFATTYAIGKAATYHLGCNRLGIEVRSEEIVRIYTESIAVAVKLYSSRQEK